MVTTLIIIAVVAAIAYFVLRNVRSMVVQNVSERVSKDIAKETVDRATGMLNR